MSFRLWSGFHLIREFKVNGFDFKSGNHPVKSCKRERAILPLGTLVLYSFNTYLCHNAPIIRTESSLIAAI